MTDRAWCPDCGAYRCVKADGTMRWHLGETFAGRWRQLCGGVGKKPVDTPTPTPGAVVRVTEESP